MQTLALLPICTKLCSTKLISELLCLQVAVAVDNTHSRSRFKAVSNITITTVCDDTAHGHLSLDVVYHEDRSGSGRVRPSRRCHEVLHVARCAMLLGKR